MRCSSLFAALFVLPFALAHPGFDANGDGGIAVNQNKKFPVGEFQFDYDQNNLDKAYHGPGQKNRHINDHELQNVKLGINKKVDVGKVGGKDLGLDIGLDYQDLDSKDHESQHHQYAGTTHGVGADAHQEKLKLGDINADKLKLKKVDRDDEDVAFVTDGGKKKHALLASDHDKSQELEKEKFRAQRLEAIRIKAHEHEDAELQRHQLEKQKAEEEKKKEKEKKREGEGEGEKGVWRW
ncbi:hypothetical protein JCM5296_000179 [Sporobolomyces johnsonii]